MNNIDNSKYYNDALAYDFSLFSEKRSERPIQRQPQKQQKIIKFKNRNQKKKIPESLFYTVSLIICLICIILSVFIKSKINETHNEISKLNKEIDAAKSQIVSLECQMESIISYSNIEIEATRLGMSKVSREQIKFIRVHNEDTCEFKKIK